MKTKLQIAIIFIFLASMVTQAQTDYNLEFDGVKDRVYYASDATLNNLNSATDYTIEVWVKPLSTDIHNRTVLKRFDQFALTLYQNDNKRFYFTHYGGSTTYVNSTNNAIKINEWNHLVVVCNSVDNSVKLYANGVEVTDGTQTALTLKASPSAANFYLGYGGSGTHLNANIDKIRIKTTAEVIGDLQTNITDTDYTTNADTVVLLNLNEGTGTSASNDAIGGTNAVLQCGPGSCTGEPVWTSLKHIWDGSASADWTTNANWDTNIAPTATESVAIPSGTSNEPIIGATTNVKIKELIVNAAADLSITSGGTLIVSEADASTGNITYNVAVGDDKWYLISSPVFGENYNDTWANNNVIADGSGTNRGISTYQNGTPDPTTGAWVYMQDTESGTFDSGKGYSLKRTASGTYSFKGAFSYNTKTPAISTGESGWNLIGNPYASFLNIADFITENTTTNDNLSDAYSAVYIWDPTSGINGEYFELTAGYISPGQAFFIKSKVDGTASITEALQVSSPAPLPLKNTDISINLSLTNGTSIKNTKINYLEGKTASLDPSFDIGMFNGVASDIRLYTHLIEDNEGIAFARQALPNTNLESLVVPVGVKATINSEITFSAATSNLPEGINIYLEDRITNTFTRLDELNTNYKITLTETLNGIGRFYLHTAQKALSVDKNVNIENISIFKTDKSTLRVVGLQQGKASVKLYNVLGKQVLNSSFTTNGISDISLPILAKGVYIVQLETATGKLNKKIVLE